MSELERAISRRERVRQILGDTSAVLTDSHFVYTSGRHGDAYVNKDAIYPHTQATRELCGMWAEDFRGKDVDVVVGPAMGGVILSHDTASELSRITGKHIPGVYAEKGKEDDFIFTRGYEDFVRGKKVLVVEDVLTTGGSAKRVIDAVRKLDGEVVGLAVIANRGNVKPEDVGVDNIDALINVQMDSWAEEECIKCEAGVPVNVKVGKGKEFLAKKSQTPSA
ncbi:MAG TPA: phosphoribosyltransferase family protein [Patescibacteria group bacterium]|nr:phosphoribosyltransferase family protein [Patescibacteria group bacterium]